jgi:putative glycosyltransferase (TIGR04372 family)
MIKALVRKSLYAPLIIFIGIPGFILIKILRPWVLIRVQGINCGRIGHFAGNMEMYYNQKLAGVNMPASKHFDLFFFNDEPICNAFLAQWWKKALNIFPFWLLYPLRTVIRVAPGGKEHMIMNTSTDRDIYNLLDKYPPHFVFTEKDEINGRKELALLGIPPDAKIVTLLVRDSAYLAGQGNKAEWAYHNYRDCNVSNFVFAAEQLAEKHGYYVVRMGKKALEPIISNNPKIIDYAFHKQNSDFMDIYLGAKCEFCITTGAGWDNVPAVLFRKPVVFINLVPFGRLSTYSSGFIVTTERHIDKASNRELTISEIFDRNLAFSLKSGDFEDANIKLQQNSPEEIWEAVAEMLHYLHKEKELSEDAEKDQKHFWDLYATHIGRHMKDSKNLHGEYKARFSSNYLSKNKKWVA